MIRYLTIAAMLFVGTIPLTAQVPMYKIVKGNFGEPPITKAKLDSINFKFSKVKNRDKAYQFLDSIFFHFQVQITFHEVINGKTTPLNYPLSKGIQIKNATNSAAEFNDYGFLDFNKKINYSWSVNETMLVKNSFFLAPQQDQMPDSLLLICNNCLPGYQRFVIARKNNQFQIDASLFAMDSARVKSLTVVDFTTNAVQPLASFNVWFMDPLTLNKLKKRIEEGKKLNLLTDKQYNLTLQALLQDKWHLDLKELSTLPEKKDKNQF